MRLSSRAACGLAPLLLMLAGGHAHAEGTVRIVSFGEFSVARELGFRDPATIDGDGEPVRTVDGVRVIQQTSRIEARLCRRFGIRFALEGMGPDGVMDVTIRTRHPPMNRPGAPGGEGTQYKASIGAERPGWVGFTFDYPYELVPGKWSFALLSGGQVLAEQVFDVTVPPDADQTPPGGCGAAVS